jgi:hypothetical protein
MRGVEAHHMPLVDGEGLDPGMLDREKAAAGAF